MPGVLKIEFAGSREEAHAYLDDRGAGPDVKVLRGLSSNGYPMIGVRWTSYHAMDQARASLKALGEWGDGDIVDFRYKTSKNLQ